jgi:dTDP-4-amino-4,6-dideoxygalactose transaminase
MKSRIYLSSPHMGGAEQEYINEAFSQNWIAPIGPNVDGFEAELGNYLDGVHVAVVSSGTAAIHLALINLGIGPGDEVLVPTFTFSATVNPIVYQGAMPVLVDSEPATWNIDPVLLEAAIEARIRDHGKAPAAMIVVHLYGMPAQMDRIMEIASHYNIPVIEDAAESLGSTYKDQQTGTFGAMGILSFNGNKIITTSGGGALLSHHETFIRHARFLSTQARDDAPWYQHSHIGYNYRMSNIVAGIGRGQLKVLDQRVEARRAVFAWYQTLFAEISGVTLLNEPDGSYSNRWLTCIVIDPEKTGGITHLQLMENLAAENIEARHIWKPMHMQPAFVKAPAYVNGTSESIFNHGICLPSGSNMSRDDLRRIEEVVKRTFKIS